MPFHLQPRDITILEDLGEYGLLDTEMIRERHWPKAKSERACQNRLELLRDLNVGRRRLKTAGWVVVRDHNRRGAV